MAKDCINSIDRSLIMIPYELIMMRLRDMELLIDKKLLLVITYILKKIVHIEDINIVKEKLDRALERLYDIKNEIRIIDDNMDEQLYNLGYRLKELENEPDIYINQSSINFNFDIYRRRVGWILSEYLCRKSFINTVDLLIKSECIENLVDVSLYNTFNNIKLELLDKKLDNALKWAEEYNSKLIKIDSLLLYELRLQYLLIKSMDNDCNIDKLLKLINNYITDDVLLRCNDAKSIITACIMYNTDYKLTLCNNRWNYLIIEFEKTISKLYGFREKPILFDLIQAGFSAIKSKGCRDNKTPTCPACLPEWSNYIEKVPTLHKLQSVLICPITGTVMDYSNPPLASPDGYVYSKNALKYLNRNNNNDDFIICPKTHKSIHVADFKKYSSPKYKYIPYINHFYSMLHLKLQSLPSPTFVVLQTALLFTSPSASRRSATGSPLEVII